MCFSVHNNRNHMVSICCISDDVINFDHLVNKSFSTLNSLFFLDNKNYLLAGGCFDTILLLWCLPNSGFLCLFPSFLSIFTS